MNERTLLIVGAGGHGKAVAEAALLSGEWQRIVFADDRWPALRETFGWPVVSDVAGLAALEVQAEGAIAAIGNNAMQQQCVKTIHTADCGWSQLWTLGHYVSTTATIGAGKAMIELAIVGLDAAIGARA